MKKDWAHYQQFVKTKGNRRVDIHVEGNWYDPCCIRFYERGEWAGVEEGMVSIMPPPWVERVDLFVPIVYSCQKAEKLALRWLEEGGKPDPSWLD